jgi:hypothetical protein
LPLAALELPGSSSLHTAPQLSASVYTDSSCVHFDITAPQYLSQSLTSVGAGLPAALPPAPAVLGGLGSCIAGAWKFSMPATA